MNTQTNTPILAPQLAKEARQLLDKARLRAAGEVAQELEKIVPALQAVASTGKEPAGVPAWASEAFLDATMPDGSICWATGRAHLTARTVRFLAGLPVWGVSADLMAALEAQGVIYSRHSFPQEGGPVEVAEVSGYALAKCTGIDLYSFAAKCWAEMDGRQADIAVEAA